MQAVSRWRSLLEQARRAWSRTAEDSELHPLAWATLLVLLVATTAAATWHLRAQQTASEEIIAYEVVDALPALAAPLPLIADEPVTVPATPPSERYSPQTEINHLRQRVRGPETPAREVDRWTLRFATSHREEMERMMFRMGRYEPLIRQSLARNEIPQDLLYLALIESGFKPSATSRVGAGGIWQFMPATARQYGLEVSHYVDERRDPIRSTEAAVRHLRDLHREFRSWHLAAAAYNAGGGRVGRTLQRYGPRQRGDEVLYWMIRPHLPRETQDYVPKLLAAARIAKERERFGFPPLQGDDPLAFREVWVPGGTPLSTVARSTQTDPSAVERLNPHLIRTMTPPGRRWPVRIPIASTPARSAGIADAGYSSRRHPATAR